MWAVPFFAGLTGTRTHGWTIPIWTAECTWSLGVTHTCGPEPQGVIEQAKEEPWQPMSRRMAMGSGAERARRSACCSDRWTERGTAVQRLPAPSRGQTETPCPHGSDGPAWPTALYTGHTLLGQETPCSPQPRTRWPCLNTSSPGHSLARPQGITYASSLGCAQCLPDPGYRAEAYISTAFLTSPSLRLLPQQPPSGFYGRGVR